LPDRESDDNTFLTQINLSGRIHEGDAMIQFRCPSCDKRLRVSDDEDAGCQGRCSCGALLKIPRPGELRPVKVINEIEPRTTFLMSCVWFMVISIGLVATLFGLWFLFVCWCGGFMIN